MQQYPIEDGQIRFLFIGRVMREKGVDELFCSMEQLHEKYPNIMLDVVGWCEEDYETRLQELQEKGLVTFHGFQRDVKPFIRKAHVFVLPSYHEGMANEEKWQMGKKSHVYVAQHFDKRKVVQETVEVLYNIGNGCY